MDLITSPIHLQRAFTGLLRSCTKLHIASAWMREGFALREIIRCKPRFQAVLGTDFGMTDAAAVEALWRTGKQSDCVRLFKTPGGIFHPKLYLFKVGEHWEALIGSANMTAAAFSENREATLHVRLSEDGSGRWLAAWTDWWDACDRLSVGQLHHYRKLSAKWSRAPVVNLTRRADLDHRSLLPINGAKPLPRMGPRLSEFCQCTFPEYIGLLRRRLRQNRWTRADYLVDSHQYSGYLSVIERAHAVLKQDGFPHSSSEDEFSLVLGTRRDTGWLGSLLGLRTGWRVLRDPAFGRQMRSRVRPLIAAATAEEILRTGQSLFEFVMDQEGLSNGVATRLLALTRPDRFFSVNNRSADNLATMLGTTPSELKSWVGYRAAAELLWTARWFLADQPEEQQMARLWRVRVAILDAAVVRMN